MIRGFLAGSLTLIAIYVFGQEGPSRKVAAGGDVLNAGLRRWLSPDVAGVRQRKRSAAPSSGTTPGKQATTKPSVDLPVIV